MSEEAKNGDRAGESAALQAEPEASAGPEEADKPGPLQFDKADFEGAPAAPECVNCHKAVESSYYQIGAAIVCPPCRDLVTLAIETGKGSTQLLRALAYGTGAMLLSTIVWYAIRELTGYEFGLVAIGVGILVGLAVKRGAGGFGGKRYQALAMFLTYASIALTNVPPIVKAITDQSPAADVQPGAAPAPAPAGPADPQAAPRDAPAPPETQPAGTPAQADAAAPSLSGFLLAWAFIFLLALASPFLGGFENIMGLIIIGIGLYEAWKINRYQPPLIQGPFQVGTASSAAGPAAS